MSFPSDVFLPSNAKYLGIVNSTSVLNPNWDIIWSFTFALTGTEHAFSTFLCDSPTISSAIPGQYVGYSSNYSRAVSITFDTTGYSALSNAYYGGVKKNELKRNSLIVRGPNDQLLLYDSLSNLYNTFFLSSSSKNDQTLRFRLVNYNKQLYIDYKKNNSEYINLTSIRLSSFNIDNYPSLYVGFAYTTPVSSNSITPSTLFLNNLDVIGSSSSETTETIPMTSFVYDTTPSFTYTSINSISSI